MCQSAVTILPSFDTQRIKKNAFLFLHVLPGVFSLDFHLLSSEDEGERPRCRHGGYECVRLGLVHGMCWSLKWMYFFCSLRNQELDFFFNQNCISEVYYNRKCCIGNT